MAQKVCKQCRMIIEGTKCPNCGSEEILDAFKGKIAIINPEASEFAQKLKITKKGVYAIKLG